MTSRPDVRLRCRRHWRGGDINLPHNGSLTRALRDIYPLTLGQLKVICMSMQSFPLGSWHRAKFNFTKRTNINLSFYLSNIQCTGQNKILQRPVSWNYFWPRSSEPRDMPPCHWLNFSSSSWVLIGRFCALLHNQTNSPVNWKLWQIHLHNQTNYPTVSGRVMRSEINIAMFQF